MRQRMSALAWVFIASPVLIVALGRGRYSVAEAAFMPAVGLGMLIWLRRRPAKVPEHLASVEYVQPDDYHGPDALTTPFYLAWCDCGWSGDDQPNEEAARREAREHAPEVRPGLHAWASERQRASSNRTPVSSSETLQSRRAVVSSVAARLGWTSVGGPWSSPRPDGPA
jgi:hypothetical protein